MLYYIQNIGVNLVLEKFTEFTKECKIFFQRAPGFVLVFYKYSNGNNALKPEVLPGRITKAE